ncbi:hypothetical protein [Wenxinia marina]|uniref:Uncharacterized protein n=1 Tax=Wenxinia marina DSM 24838 TaxID=1123501 RepID=A0A0D0Q603_9RHOB|nr:hypothetical protein [Wenxinia marina]KIQ69904.1 hypothetical protein Wenmar_01474 [Wenxinia marina DSM 24838]GGL62114.1 hypothetical protein GCM10011392_15770 [Wenxinia marina]
MLEPDVRGVLLEISPSPPRRAVAVGAFYAIGGLSAWLAVGPSPPALFAVLLMAVAILALLAGEALRRATRRHILLTEEGLADSEGIMLARWDEMAALERGAFAMKPSNGFLLIRRTPGPRGWVPGVWWRLGRRVGVGGVLSRQPTRFLAEQIEQRLAGGG